MGILNYIVILYSYRFQIMRNVHFRPTNHDEMCNFYIMFTTTHKGMLENLKCFNSAQEITWKRFLGDAVELPNDASTLNGVTLMRPSYESEMHME